MNKIRVLLVDDQLLFLESLKIVLENCSDEIEIIGLAKDGNEAVALAREKNPQVILMDISMPVMNGIEAAEAIKKFMPKANIIMLTTFEDKEKVQEALKMGINGYLLKNIKPELLIQYIIISAQGGIFLSSEVVNRLCDQTDENKSDLKTFHCDDYYLTKREEEILRYLSEDLTNNEIADKIHLGHQTIRNYISMIYSKLNVSNRMEAIKKIQKRNL